MLSIDGSPAAIISASSFASKIYYRKRLLTARAISPQKRPGDGKNMIHERQKTDCVHEESKSCGRLPRARISYRNISGTKSAGVSWVERCLFIDSRQWFSVINTSVTNIFEKFNKFSPDLYAMSETVEMSRKEC